MKRNDELTLNDVLYGVSSERIVAYKIECLKMLYSDTLEARIVLHGGSCAYYEGLPENCRLTAKSSGDFPHYLFSDLEVAQSQQKEERYKSLEKAKENMLKAQEEYFALVEKYKGTVCDNDIAQMF